MKPLNPIQQRLFLYAFARVDLDPLNPSARSRWGLPGLQGCFVGSDAPSWRQSLPPVQDFSSATTAPVISNSIGFLKDVRRRQPQRPLILARTAFEPLTKDQTLRSLISIRHPIAGLAHPSDPLKPLYMLGDVPGRLPRIQVLDKPHPRAKALRDATISKPLSQFTPTEEGAILEQPWLFSPRGFWQPEARFWEMSEMYDRQLLSELTTLQKGAIFVAKDPELLAWMRRDCTRLLSKRYCCWNFPEMPDPRDPLIHFIFATDRSLRFERLDKRLQIRCLDGGFREQQYRAIRSQPANPPKWRHMGHAIAGAKMVYRGCGLFFYKNQEGWFSGDGPVSVPDQSPEFQQRADTLQALNVMRC